MTSLRSSGSGPVTLSWSPSGELLITPSQPPPTPTPEVPPFSQVRLTPASLLHYRYEQTVVGPNGLPTYDRTVSGLAVLDQDGLVLADLPGDWEAVADFAAAGGVALHEALGAPAARVRSALAARAPGWRRITGVSPPPPARWRKPVAIGLGVLALGAMVYLTTSGFWYVWRSFSAIGRMLIDVVEVKWLIFLFSPLLLFLAPVRERLGRRSVRKGAIVASTGGLHLRLTSGILYINRASQTETALPTTPPLPTPPLPTPPLPTPPRSTPHLSTPQPPATSPPPPPPPGTHPDDHLPSTPKSTPEPQGSRVQGGAAGLFLYRYQDLAGLVVLAADGQPIHHLPGPWSPEHVNLFAARHKLPLEIRTLTHEEYLALTTKAADATV
ncbi:hypothetical protein ACIBEJ_18980 [Nonomuraea sp. NPDC050790]|uniref:hypothetical protein n=1 Tax=Nonomuraea sp. NPDC050790 TaxID=3364371 RepID=UPI0037AB5481